MLSFEGHFSQLVIAALNQRNSVENTRYPGSNKYLTIVVSLSAAEDSVAIGLA